MSTKLFFQHLWVSGLNIVISHEMLCLVWNYWINEYDISDFLNSVIHLSFIEAALWSICPLRFASHFVDGIESFRVATRNAVLQKVRFLKFSQKTRYCLDKKKMICVTINSNIVLTNCKYCTKYTLGLEGFLWSFDAFRFSVLTSCMCSHTTMYQYNNCNCSWYVKYYYLLC